MCCLSYYEGICDRRADGGQAAGPYWQRHIRPSRRLLETAAAASRQSWNDIGTAYDAGAAGRRSDECGGKDYCQPGDSGIVGGRWPRTRGCGLGRYSVSGRRRRIFQTAILPTWMCLYPSRPFLSILQSAHAGGADDAVMKLRRMSRWRFPLHSHDLGRIPRRNGQEYSGGELTKRIKRWRRAANRTDTGAALDRAEVGDGPGITNYAEDILARNDEWAKYVRAEGMDPASQLRTDEFCRAHGAQREPAIKRIDALGPTRVCRLR